MFGFYQETATDVFEAMAGAVLDRGGEVLKFIGDAVMAVWGAQKANEDDPERAVRAASNRSHRSIERGLCQRFAQIAFGHVPQAVPAGLIAIQPGRRRIDSGGDEVQLKRIERARRRRRAA